MSSLTHFGSMNLYLILVASISTLVLIFLLTTLIKTKKTAPKKTTAQPKTIITSQDIKAIAGDNVMATQLDLARAYIEMNKKQLAKKILEHVLQNGDSHQKLEAEQLITDLI